MAKQNKQLKQTETGVKAKVKLHYIYLNTPTINKLLSLDLPLSLSFKISKIIDVLNDEVEKIEKVKVEKIKSIGVTKEDGSVVIEEEEKRNKFIEEFNSFLNEEVVLDIEPIDISLIPEETVNKIVLSSKDINILVKIGVFK